MKGDRKRKRAGFGINTGFSPHDNGSFSIDSQEEYSYEPPKKKYLRLSADLHEKVVNPLIPTLWQHSGTTSGDLRCNPPMLLRPAPAMQSTVEKCAQDVTEG